MKKQIFFILSLSSALILNAYEFSFYNNTDTPIVIAIQFTGNDTKEPLYPQLVKPKSMMTFTPGRIGIPEIKWGFCLDNLYYIENPTTEQKAHHFAETPWRKIEITWVQKKSKTKQSKKSQLQKKTALTAAATSLCRDRHFDIIRDPSGKIGITASLVE